MLLGETHPQNNYGLIEIEKDKLSIFEGWIFASSPALNAMEHPVYDVSLISCKKDKTFSNKSSSSTLKD